MCRIRFAETIQITYFFNQIGPGSFVNKEANEPCLRSMNFVNIPAIHLTDREGFVLNAQFLRQASVYFLV